MNPTSAWEAIEVFLGYIILKLSPTEDIQFRTLKPLRIIIYNYDHDLNAWNFSIPLGLLPGRVYPPPLKQVGCVTSLNDPTVVYPIHLKLSSLTPGAGLGHKK